MRLAQLNTARGRALVAERIRCNFPEFKKARPGDTICGGKSEVGPCRVSTAPAQYQESCAGDDYDQGDDGQRIHLHRGISSRLVHVRAPYICCVPTAQGLWLKSRLIHTGL